MPRRKPKVPGKVGHPPHVPTETSRHRVLKLAGQGWTYDDICDMEGIGLNSLRKYYSHEIKTGKKIALSKVIETMFGIATNPDHRGCVSAGTFILKTQAGWRETNRTEITGAYGSPIQLQATASSIDPRDLSIEQRDNLREILKIAMVAHTDAEDAEFEEIENDDGDEA